MIVGLVVMLDCLMRFDEDWGGCGIIEEIIARKI